MQARIQQLSQLVPDKRIHNYAFNTQAIIGRGAYGVVYVGKNTETKYQFLNQSVIVALKAVPVQSFNTDTQQLLQKEIDIMKDLDCPNIVKLIDVLTTSNNCYIVSELCTGGDLREFMKRAGPIDETVAVKILTQILRGILQSFKRGIIHRDLKPANILIAQNQVFKIADFGFAKRFDKLEDDLMTSLVGTPLYMSPQVLLRRQYTAKCDVWSIGLIYYELLEGVTPWAVRDILDLVNKQRNQKITFKKRISKVSQQFILGCLAYEESSRLGWEQVFTHPLFQSTFEKKQETQQPTQQQQIPQQVQQPQTPNPHNTTMPLPSSKSQQQLPIDRTKKHSISPLQSNNTDKPKQMILKTNGSPYDEENRMPMRACLTQPNTMKKDRTVSVIHQKAESSSTTRYSDNKLQENYKSDRGKHTNAQSEPKLLFQRQLSDTDEFSANRNIILQQFEYLCLLKRLRMDLLQLFGNNQNQGLTVNKLQFLLLKNVMIKSTDIKVNLFDRQINCLDLKDYERYKYTDQYRSLEKQILEIHFETFNQYQESCLTLNENLTYIMKDSDFLEIFNNNFEYSLHFARLAYQTAISFIRGFLYDQVLECANAKVVNFTYMMCLYVNHLQSMSFSNSDIQLLLQQVSKANTSFTQTRMETLHLMDKFRI